jgi:hypothetical protein
MMTEQNLDIAREATPDRSVTMVSVRTGFGILAFGVVWFAFLRGLTALGRILMVWQFNFWIASGRKLTGSYMPNKKHGLIVETPTEIRHRLVLSLSTISTCLAVLILGCVWFAFFRI